jgi:hypothetical protein
MTAAGFGMFIKAIRVHCMSACKRERCYGCPFERHSERKRQIQLFEERRARVTATRRAAAQAAR